MFFLEVRLLNTRLQRISSLLRTWLAPLVAVSIIIGILFGLVYPDVSQGLDVLIPITVFAMLYPPLINIDLGSLRKDVTNARFISSIVVLNFVFAPLVAAFYAQFLNPIDPLLAVGFILKLSVPAAPMVVAWTGLAKGRTETALTAVTLSYILSFFFIPFWTLTLVGTIVTVPVNLFLNSLVIYVAIPLIIGIASRQIILRYRGQELLNSVKPTLPPISSIGMFGIVFIIMAREATIIVSHLSSIFVIVMGIVIIYPILFLLSIAYSKAVGFDYGDTIALGYTVTAKSHGLTIALAISTFGGLSVLPAAIAPIVQIPLMLVILHAGPRLQRFMEGPKDTSKTEDLKEEADYPIVTE